MDKKRFEFLIFFLIFLVLPVLSADVISINSGGDNEMIISPDPFIEGFFNQVCISLTCSALGYNCNSWSDGCGGTINCGSCSSGYTCSSGVCTAIPVPPVTPPSGGGAGEAPERPKLLELRAIPSEFNIPTTVGITTSAKISLLNTGSSELNVFLSLTGSLKPILSFDENSFIIKPGETKNLEFKITAPNEPGIYTGKIIFSSGGKTLEIPFILGVDSKLSLFDISLDIPKENRIINVGKNLIGQISLIQAGLQKEVDVIINYIIKDLDDNLYLEQSETIMVYKQKNYEHEFITENLPAGDYVLGAEVIYSGGVATASYPIKIIDERKNRQINIIYFVLAFLLIASIILIFIILKYYKQQKSKYKRKK